MANPLAYLDIVEILDSIGEPLTESRNETFVGGHLLSHESSSGTCLVVWPDTSTFYCSSCGKRGDLADFLVAVGGVENEPMSSRDEAIEWLHKKLGAPPTDWKVPIPLPDIFGPPLPVGIFPPVVDRFISAYAQNIQVAREIVATPCLAAMSCVVGPRARLKIPRLSTSDRLNVYTMVVAYSGERKSPAFKEATRPIRDLEDEEIARAENLATTQNITAQKLRDKRKELYKDVGDDFYNPEKLVPVAAVDKEIAENEAISEPRLMTSDVTHQRLVSLLADNNEVMAIMSDEAPFLSAIQGRWSDGMDDYDIYLNAWNGQYYTLDRETSTTASGSKVSKSIRLDRPILTIGVCVQPTVLLGLLKNKRLTDKGFLPRFLITVPRGKLGSRDMNEVVEVPARVVSEYNDAIRRIYKLPLDTKLSPRDLTLTEEARALLAEYHNELEPQLDKKKLGRFSSTSLQASANKFVPHVGMIAGNFHFFEHYKDADPTIKPVSASTMARAIRYIKHIAEHWIAVSRYSNETDEIQPARELLHTIKIIRENDALESTFDITDLQRLHDPPTTDIKNALSTLQRLEWGRFNENGTRFELNPKAADIWEDELEQGRLESLREISDLEQHAAETLKIPAQEVEEIPIEEPEVEVAAEPKTTEFPEYEDINWEYIDSPERAQAVVTELLQESVLGIDIETTGLDPMVDNLRLVQIARQTATYLFDLNHIDKEVLRPILEGPCKKLLHNAKFDIRFLMCKFEGIVVPNIFCTMVIDQVVNKGGKPRKLYKVSEDRVWMTLNKESQKSKWGAKVLTKAQLKYAAADASVLLPIHDELIRRAEELKLIPTVELENRVVPLIAWMIMCGIAFDLESWTKLSEDSEDKLRAIEMRMDSLLDYDLPERDKSKPMNWNAHQQVKTVLNALGLGVQNVLADTLGMKKDKHSLVPLILERKKLEKWTSSYGSSWSRYVSEIDHRIHPKWNQLGAATGRMSCGSPNLQQIPNNDLQRDCFKPAAGKVYIKADYGQIELRVIAHIAKDKRMTKAFREGKDLHEETALLLTGKEDISDISEEERGLAKAVNFGLIYGMGAPALATYAKSRFQVELTQEDAIKFRKQFFDAYVGIRKWHNTQSKVTETRTELGRVRNVAYESRNVKFNSPVQGTAADGIKEALALLYESPERKKFNANLVMAVHDDILLEVPEEYAEPAKEWLEHCMKKGMRKFIPDIPITVSASITKAFK